MCSENLREGLKQCLKESKSLHKEKKCIELTIVTSFLKSAIGWLDSYSRRYEDENE